MGVLYKLVTEGRKLYQGALHRRVQEAKKKSSDEWSFLDDGGRGRHARSAIAAMEAWRAFRVKLLELAAKWEPLIRNSSKMSPQVDARKAISDLGIEREKTYKSLELAALTAEHYFGDLPKHPPYDKVHDLVQSLIAAVADAKGLTKHYIRVIRAAQDRDELLANLDALLSLGGPSRLAAESHKKRHLPLHEDTPPGYQTIRGPKNQSCESCEYSEHFSDNTGKEGHCRLFDVPVERQAWCREWTKSTRLDHQLPSGQESPMPSEEEPDAKTTAMAPPKKKKFGFQKKQEEPSEEE